ncbi:MAG TPA: mechanosensitive ion channel family protein [Pseudomonadota bacterium]|nr:mechanosensitive ion channel family protein [Pseudomonadota bacterium]
MNPPSLETMEQTKRVLTELALRYGPRLLTAILIFAAGAFVARQVNRLAGGWLTRRDLDVALAKLLGRMAGLLVLLVFTLMALQNLGVELLPLIASLGVVGVGAGLAMQGVLSNLVAGLTIILSGPFRVGEYISVIGVEGQVESIELFTTTLLHPDRSQVVIPNRKLVGEVLHNYGKLRQLNLQVGVAYATELPRALSVIRQVLSQNPRVLSDPTPVVGVGQLAESAIAIAVRPWVAVSDYIDAIGELNQALVEACRREGIDLALPQQEVRLLSDGKSR